jgi:uncharacterized membrane protein
VQTLFNISLIIHIASGTLALITGLIVIIAEKGTRFHKTIGRIYYWAMTSVAIFAVIMSFIHKNDFLFMLAFLSYYLVYTGFWAHRQNEKARPMDWIVMAAVFIAGASRFYVTLAHPWNDFAIVPFVFSIGCMSATIQDFIAYMRKRMYNSNSVTRHIGRMLGSYIAAVTAFLVVNFHTDPAYILWLGPTVIGSVLITVWIIKYKRREAFLLVAEENVNKKENLN